MCPEQPLSGTLFLSFPDFAPLKGIDHMTSTLCRSAALALIIIVFCVAKLAEFRAMAVKVILTIAGIARPGLQDCAKSGPRLPVFWYGCPGRFTSRRLARFVAASGTGAEMGRSSWVRSFMTDGMGLINKRVPT